MNWGPGPHWLRPQGYWPLTAGPLLRESSVTGRERTSHFPESTAFTWTTTQRLAVWPLVFMERDQKISLLPRGALLLSQTLLGSPTAEPQEHRGLGDGERRCRTHTRGCVSPDGSLAGAGGRFQAFPGPDGRGESALGAAEQSGVNTPSQL